MPSKTRRRSLRRTLPDWGAVQRGQNAGVTLINLWRDYAAQAAIPYLYPAFCIEFRKWQSAAPVSPSEEYAASDRFWHGRASPRPDILVLDDGATLRARGSQLEVYNPSATSASRSDGLASQAASLPSVTRSRLAAQSAKQQDGCREQSFRGFTTRFDAGPHHRKPKAIIFAGWGGSFSTAAARFCVDHRITVLTTGWLGDLLTFVAPRPIQDATLVRVQCSARPSPIAREIVIQKFRHYRATARMSKTDFDGFLARLNHAHTVAVILGIEATGSSLAWVPWQGVQLIPRTGRILPPWLARPFRCRASGIGATGARHATDPINAMLNLAYAKEAGRLGAMLAASGACLAIGFLHCDKPHRHSLVLRLSTGHVRMVPGLIKLILERTALPETDIKLAIEFMLGLINETGFRGKANIRSSRTR